MRSSVKSRAKINFIQAKRKKRMMGRRKREEKKRKEKNSETEQINRSELNLQDPRM